MASKYYFISPKPNSSCYYCHQVNISLIYSWQYSSPHWRIQGLEIPVHPKTLKIPSWTKFMHLCNFWFILSFPPSKFYASWNNILTWWLEHFKNAYGVGRNGFSNSFREDFFFHLWREFYLPTIQPALYHFFYTFENFDFYFL
jgi:hypothetical protein